MSQYQELYEAILKGDAKASVAQTEAALAAGADPEVVVKEAMITAMDEVGRRFEADEYFVPELMISARAMKAALEIVRPLLAKSGVKLLGRVVIGTVKGDLHDIGKNLVGSMLEGGGFEVIDLGADVAPEKFAQAAKENGASLVGLSALLTTTMPSMKSTMQALEEMGIRDQVKVIIGGAPITQEYADEIGADGYGDNAHAAVTLARKLTGA